MTYFPDEISDFKDSVRVASTAALTLASPGSTIDGVTMATGDRVLVKDQGTASENGIYVWNGAASAMTRAFDADDDTELTAGSHVTVEEGTANADTSWIVDTDGPIQIGTDAISFTEISGSGGTLGDLDDVDATGVVDGSLLRYEDTPGEWRPTTASSLLVADDGTLEIATSSNNPGIEITQASGGGTIFNSTVSGDTAPYRFRITADGDLNWQRNDGTNDSSIDFNPTLGRLTFSAANDLYFNDSLWVTSGSSVYIDNNSAGGFVHRGADVTNRITFETKLTGDGQGRIQTLGDGRMRFGSGSATPDFEWAWSSANVLAVGSGDKIQQSELPTTSDDLVNQVWAERFDLFYA